MENDNTKSLSNATREQLLGIIEGYQDLIKSSPKVQNRISKGNDDERSGGNYYNKNDAESLRPFLDEMILDKEPREFLFSDYPQWSPNTVWLKINQAIKYIVDHDTPEGKYTIFRYKLRICKQENGVLFKIVDSPSGWIAHKIKEASDQESYKDRIFKFMENSKENEELDIKELNLDIEEMNKWKALLDSSPIFAAFISQTRVKIVHIKPE